MMNLTRPAPSRKTPPSADCAMHPFEHMLDFKTFSSLRRMVMHQQDKPLIGRADFMKQVTLYLPEVAALIEESDFGIVHLEVGAMKLATLQAIARRDFLTVRRHLRLVSEWFERADAELREAIRISYLEALFLDERAADRMEARRLLPGQMATLLHETEQALERRRSTHR